MSWTKGVLKRENEAVVNRFLLSTLFLVVLEFGFYLFNNIANDFRTFKYFTPLTYVMIAIGVIGIGVMIALACMKKIKTQSAIYYGVIFLIILVTGLFVKFFYILPFGLADLFMSVATRLKVMATLVAVVYVYEIIRYFLKVNK